MTARGDSGDGCGGEYKPDDQAQFRLNRSSFLRHGRPLISDARVSFLPTSEEFAFRLR